ncbi:MAG: hypothetical protein WC733_00215, partial [Methylophilus sp.]
MAYNVDKARQAGYSDSEIADYLSSKSNFNIKKARESGYEDTEIISHLQAKKTSKETGVIDTIKNGVSYLADAFNHSSDPQSVIKTNKSVGKDTFKPSKEAVSELLPSTEKNRIQQDRIAKISSDIDSGATSEEAAKTALVNNDERLANGIAEVTKPVDMSYAKELTAKPYRSLGDYVGDTANAVGKIPAATAKGVVDVANMVTGDSVDLGVSQRLERGMQ